MKTTRNQQTIKAFFSSSILLLLLVLPLGAQTFTVKTLAASGRPEYNSQAVVNGKPAIAYFDTATDDLKYMQANDATGTTWSAPITLDSNGLVGFEPSMAVVNGNPAIAYRDVTNLDLKYVRALDPDGTTWGTPVTVDNSAGNVGGSPSLTMVNGNPAICHHDLTNNQLKYVRASDATGSSWNVPVTLVGTGAPRSSLKVINGNPAVAYSASAEQDLKFVRAFDQNGTNWSPPVTVDSNGSVGDFSRLEVVNGNPAISYFEGTTTTDKVKYVRASDANGATWNTPVVVNSSSDDAGPYTSLAVVNGKPAVAYTSFTPRSLKYVAASDANGANWSTPVTVDNANSPLYFVSLVAINGNPAISYVFSAATNTLKWASALPGAPAQVGNISTRLAVGTGDNALIGGFIITGTQPKRVIIRAIGPSLPLTGVLADPILEFHGSDGTAITNDNWRTTQEAEIIATGVPPGNDLESAIVATLPPGGHTAIVRGTGNTTGVGLVEVYDLDAAANSRMANVSTRGFVQTGNDVLIGGTIVTGTGSANALIRAIGPSLAGLGVQNALADPTLELYDGSGSLVASNDQWQETQQAEIQATGLAPTNTSESAILRSLSPGAYTAIVRGKNQTTGVGLIEVYALQ